MKFSTLCERLVYVSLVRVSTDFGKRNVFILQLVKKLWIPHFFLKKKQWSELLIRSTLIY